MWEHYKYGIFRAIPLNKTAFLDSPIYDLITIITWKLHTIIRYSLGENLKLGTCVLQRIPANTFIAEHTDECNKRRVSFIYYLVPGDFDENDGGILHIKHPSRCITSVITPKFNQLTMWLLPNKNHPSTPTKPISLLNMNQINLELLWLDSSMKFEIYS